MGFDVEAGDSGKAGRRREGGGEDAQGGGFSGTVWAEKGGNLPAPDAEGDAAERFAFPEPAGQGVSFD